MAQEYHYVITYKIPAVDDSPHYLVMIPPSGKELPPFLASFAGSHPGMILDTAEECPRFDTMAEAEAHARALGDIANLQNPDRIDAAIAYDVPNRQLEYAKKIAVAPAGDRGVYDLTQYL